MTMIQVLRVNDRQSTESLIGPPGIRHPESYYYGFFEMASAQLLLGSDQLLSNERKNQTKVDLLIHSIRTMISSLVVVE